LHAGLTARESRRESSRPKKLLALLAFHLLAEQLHGFDLLALTLEFCPSLLLLLMLSLSRLSLIFTSAVRE